MRYHQQKTFAEARLLFKAGPEMSDGFEDIEPQGGAEPVAPLVDAPPSFEEADTPSQLFTQEELEGTNAFTEMDKKNILTSQQNIETRTESERSMRETVDGMRERLKSWAELSISSCVGFSADELASQEKQITANLELQTRLIEEIGVSLDDMDYEFIDMARERMDLSASDPRFSHLKDMMARKVSDYNREFTVKDQQEDQLMHGLNQVDIQLDQRRGVNTRSLRDEVFTSDEQAAVDQFEDGGLFQDLSDDLISALEGQGDVVDQERLDSAMSQISKIKSRLNPSQCEGLEHWLNGQLQERGVNYRISLQTEQLNPAS